MGGELAGRVAVVTGGASGIGRALCRRFAADGAVVAVADLDGAGARAVADALPTEAVGFGLDVTDGTAIDWLVPFVEQRLGPIDVYCSNAGVAVGPGLGADDAWERSWRVHVLAHVYAARAVLPTMARRHEGYFLVTASAAGLLTNIDSAPYSTTKHATVGLAEWLAIQYAGSGATVACLCPQGVRTPMTAADAASSATRAAGEFLEPEDVADVVVEAMADHRFLVLPHPEVAEYERRRAADRDRWISGMARLRDRIAGSGG